MTTLELPLWYDLHTHLRQGELLKPIIKSQLDMGCAGVLAMPNTKPPVAKVHDHDLEHGWSIENYRKQIMMAGGDAFGSFITPLYLTKETTQVTIEAGAHSGVLQACKYYPPHGTTNADHGAPIDLFMENGVLAAMEEHGIVLNIHGEEHGLCAERYFARGENAEEIFYRERVPKILDKFPKLKLVCEHITTKVAVDLVSKASTHVAATITPQHLLYTVGDLLQGLKYHLFCLPLVKFDEDRAALREAVLTKGQTKFFAGTDSAAHTTKCTPCGCAAGCFTGGIAPQLYAMGFEAGGANLDAGEDQAKFKAFLCDNGRLFYSLPKPKKNFRLSRQISAVDVIETPEGPIVPLPVGLNPAHEQAGTSLPWQVFVPA